MGPCLAVLGHVSMSLEAGGICGTGGFRLKSTAWVFSGLLRICADMPRPSRACALNLDSAFGKYASGRSRTQSPSLAGFLQQEEAILGREGSLQHGGKVKQL